MAQPGLEDARERTGRPLFQELLELAICWSVISAFPLAAYFAIFDFLDFIAPGHWQFAFVVSLIIALATGIAIIIWGDHAVAATHVAARLQYFAHKYSVLILLGVWLATGWCWRAEHMSDQYRAERAALDACASLPECVTKATLANGGSDVEDFIRPPRRDGR